METLYSNRVSEHTFYFEQVHLLRYNRRAHLSCTSVILLYSATQAVVLARCGVLETPV